MMSEILLAATAASVGFFHTLLSPDHYLPFIVLSKARQWTKLTTVTITLICGIGHILSSVVLGFVGVFLGNAVFKLEALQDLRGEISAWLLTAFGFTYFIWGIHKALGGKHRKHFYLHEKGDNLTRWILFIIIVFGPCEPLIPLLVAAANFNLLYLGIVVCIFGLITVATMLAIVLALVYGWGKIPLPQRYSHAIAGLVILLCGGSILLGL